MRTMKRLFEILVVAVMAVMFGPGLQLRQRGQ
jgi:hypothetical protein